MSECLIYYIKEGTTKVGSGKNLPQDIQLCGSYILPQHCEFENVDGVITLIPHENALCYVNGQEIKSPLVLKTGSRVILGKNHVFRFTHPEQGTVSPQHVAHVVTWTNANLSFINFCVSARIHRENIKNASGKYDVAVEGKIWFCLVVGRGSWVEGPERRAQFWLSSGLKSGKFFSSLKKILGQQFKKKSGYKNSCRIFL